MRHSNSTLDELFAKRRFCYFIPAEGYIEGHGWRPSVVFEGEPGHYPTGTWPYEGKPGQSCPYFWGHDYDKAVRICDQQNERMGISKALALEIVTSSMAVSQEPRGRKAGA